MTKHDKTKSRAIFIVEKALEMAFEDAVLRFPIHGESHDILMWFDELRLIIIEIVKRQTVPDHPEFKNLSIEEKAKVVFDKAAAATKKILKVEKRRAAADAYLNLELPPAPQAPEEPDEKPALLGSEDPHEKQ